MAINKGVHETHCCVLHGCKYGDNDCPVVNKEISQKYLCEYCEDEKITKKDLELVANGTQVVELITRSTNNRIESGPTKTANDWAGVFIRGDHAMYYAMLLEQILENNDNNNVFETIPLKGLVALLKSCDEKNIKHEGE